MSTIDMTILARFLTKSVILCAAMLFCSVTLAQNEGRWYQVEILIFKRTQMTPSTEEIWQQDLELSYPANSEYLPDTLPKDSHELGGHHYTLKKSENFQVLFHKAWMQQMWAADQSSSLIIRGGQQYGNHKELEGTIKIHIGRYLHLATDLWLSDFTLKDGYENEPPIYRLPTLPGQGPSDFFTEQVNPSSIITFQQKRRMRSKETHYIDHPLMGMLVRMLPLKIDKEDRKIKAAANTSVIPSQ